MADEKPNIATMEPLEYIEARMAQLPDTAKRVLGFEDPAIKSQIAHMFSVEYIRLRHTMLEGNCRELYRRYMGAMKALEKAVGVDDARRLFLESMDHVSEDIGEVPQL